MEYIIQSKIWLTSFLTIPLIILLYFINPLIEAVFEIVAFPMWTGKLCIRPDDSQDNERKRVILWSSLLLIGALTLGCIVLMIDITLPIYIVSENITTTTWWYAWIISFLGIVLIRLFALSYSSEMVRAVYYQFMLILGLLILGSFPPESFFSKAIRGYITLLGLQPWPLISVLVAIVAFIISESLVKVRAWFPQLTKTNERHLSELIDSANKKEYVVGWDAVIQNALKQISWEQSLGYPAKKIYWVSGICPPDFTQKLSNYINKGHHDVMIRIIAQENNSNKEILEKYDLIKFTKFIENIGPLRMVIINDRRAHIAVSVGPTLIGRRNNRLSNLAYVERCSMTVRKWTILFNSWWASI